MSTKSIYKKEKPGTSSKAGAAESIKDSAEKAETSTETGYVDHKEAHYKDIVSLFHRDEFQDVTFVVEGRRFSAHKAVLACRCEYFRALLFNGMRETSSDLEIKLDNVNADAFEALLQYAYTGCLDFNGAKLETCIEILGLSNQYGYQLLEKALSFHLESSLTVENCCRLYDVALFYSQDSLIDSCIDFIDRNSSKIADHPSFLTLTLGAFHSILKRDSFYVPEKVIFNCAKNWVEANLDPSDESYIEQKEKVLETIRLPLISFQDLFDTVRPTGFISADVILDTVRLQSEITDGTLLSRGMLRLNENIATMNYNAHVINGNHPSVLLDSAHTTDYDADHGYTFHDIHEGVLKDEKGIKVKLGLPSIINCINMLLFNHDVRAFSYTVQLSNNDKDWQTVADYTSSLCKGWQEIRFDRRVVRYIRVVGTRNTGVCNSIFQLVTLKACFNTEQVKVIDGYLCPSYNVATEEKGACLIDGVSHEHNALINGHYKNFDWDSGYTCHQLNSGFITIQLAQPYLISNMKLLLWDLDNRAYSYYIEFSLDNSNWTTVVDNRDKNCQSWQHLKVERTPAVFIRIVGTNNTANEVFHCVHFECSGDLEDDEKISVENKDIEAELSEQFEDCLNVQV